MPPGRPGARRRIVLFSLAGLLAGLAAVLGLSAGAYAGRVKHINWWVAGSLSTGLFISAVLAAMLAVAAGQAMASTTEPKPALPAPQSTSDKPSRRSLARWPKGDSTPRQLPKRMSHFHGREGDLATLAVAYKRAGPNRLSDSLSAINLQQITDMPLPPHPKRPLIILIHGMPGVGKTALAEEFGHRIKKAFPDGQLYANLGIARERRSPSDILNEFLKALGVQDHEMPDDEDERANLFRSLTIRKRMLLVLISARGYDQVSLLLPTGPRCVVVITSRFSLGSELGAFEYFLRPPEAEEAAGLLRAYAGIRSSDAIAPVSDIVYYCGALPLSLRSAGQQIVSKLFTPEQLAVKLRPLETRLATLRFRGQDIEDRISGEYDRLPAAEQRALRLLTLIESPTFGPWVLAPLMGISTDDADTLAASLARYHLLVDAGHVAGTSMVRYSMHPLVWIVARKRLDGRESLPDRMAALRELDAAYFGAARSVLIRREPDLAAKSTWNAASAWTPSDETWNTILSDLEHWIQTEYRQLLRAIAFAKEQNEWSICWRIAAHLGACVADGLRPEESERAFKDAWSAAEIEKDSRGRIEVLLAHGSFLAAVERYHDAFALFDRAIASTDGVDPPLSAPYVHLLKASAHRRKAEAWEQMGSYDKASRELKAAIGEVETTDQNFSDLEREQARLSLLTAENSTWLNPSSWLDRTAYDEALAVPSDYGAYFRATLGLAEYARRQRRWVNALEFLSDARGDNHGDARRTATIDYRAARLVLQQGQEGKARNRAYSMYKAASYASNAARIFRDMDDQVGMIRAKALLVRALVLGGGNKEAKVLADALESQLDRMGESSSAFGPLQARVQRSRAEVMLAANEPERASVLLLQAVELFERDGDLRSVADTRVTLAEALAKEGRPGLALARLHEAEDYYSQSGDNRALRVARRRRSKIARGANMRYWRNRFPSN